MSWFAPKRMVRVWMPALAGVLWATQAVAQPAPEPRELLQAASRETYFPARLSMAIEIVSRHAFRDSTSLRERRTVVLRRDGARLDARVRRFAGAGPGELLLSDRRVIWDGKSLWDFTAAQGALPDQLQLSASREHAEQVLARHEGLGLGRVLPGDDAPYHEVLSRADTLAVAPHRMRVDQAYCHYLTGSVEGASFELWIDPAEAHLLRRAVVVGDRRALERAQAQGIVAPSEAFAFQFTLENVRIESFPKGRGLGRPLVVEARTTLVYAFPDGTRESHASDQVRRNVLVDTDFTGTGAFQLDIPEGTIVNGAYVWRRGELAPLLETDKLAQLLVPVGDRLSATQTLTQVSPGAPAAAPPSLQVVPVREPDTSLAWLEAIALMAATLLVLIALFVFFQARRRAGRPRLGGDEL